MSCVNKMSIPPSPKWDPADPSTFWSAVTSHYAKRIEDYAWLANGPKSEVWYTTELIAALGNACPGTWMMHRIMGEETYAQIMRNLGNGILLEEDANRRPDLNIISGFSSGTQKVTVICEAKVIVNEEFDADLSSALAGKKGLLTQLRRARDRFPQAAVFGLVFVQWLDGRHYILDTTERSRTSTELFTYCKKCIETAVLHQPVLQWVSQGIEAVIPAPARGAHHGKTQNRAALGIGLIELERPNTASHEDDTPEEGEPE